MGKYALKIDEVLFKRKNRIAHIREQCDYLNYLNKKILVVLGIK